MNAKHKISRMLLALMLVVASVPWGANVSAQAEAVNVVFKVFLQLEGQEANAQNQISYDVLNADQSEFLYSYRSQEPPAESLQLAEGNYYFRLYDGGGFVREGVEIMPEKVLQTISNQTDEDKAENKTKRSLDEVGSVKTQGDGSRIYDVPFSVYQGPTLVNGDTVEIEIYLADQATIDANQNEGGSETPEPTPPPEEPTTSTVTFTVLDENQAAVPNVTIQLDELQATTGENGVATFSDIAMGDYMVSIASLPEGYTGSLEDLLTVESAEQAITLNVQTAAPAVGTLLFRVLDQNGTAVPGVGILVGDSELVTGDTGEATLSELPATDYSYQVTSLPEGYSAEVSGAVTVIGDQTVNTDITITKIAPQIGDVRFEVRDQNDAPFANVVLTIEGQEATTDENGVANVAALPVGTLNYTVAGTAAYSETYGEVTVAEGEVTETVVVNRIPQNAAASFSVTDADGQPVSGAVINISDQQITTNEEGRASVDLPFGDYEYSLAALPEGYSGEATGLATVTAEGATTTISVTKAAQTGDVVFEVSDQNDAPAANVTINIAEQSVTTNENGVVNLASLPIGTLNYTVPATDTFAETYGEVTIAEGAVTETVRVNRIPQTSSLSFIVTDQAGAGVEGAVINIADQALTTNAEGKASLADLAVGDYPYEIASLPAGYVGEASGTATVAVDATEAIAIAVEKAPQIGAASIKVVDQNEAAVVGAVVTIAEQALTTNEEGKASLSDLLVGDHTYTLTSLPEGYSGELSGTVTILAGETISETLSVTRDPQYGNVTFTVKDQEGKAVVGALIRLNEKDFTTNGDGQAIITELQAGKDYAYQLSSLPEGYSGQAEGSVTIAKDQTVEEAIAVTRNLATAKLTVVVKDQTETAVEGAVLLLAEGIEATTNGEGQAVFSDVTPKTYSLTIKQLPERYSHDLGAQEVVLAEAASETLALTVNRQITQRQINLRVLDQEDQPVDKATIVLNGQTLTTNAEGKVSLANLDPKTYTYEITGLPEGYQGAHTGDLQLTEAEDLTQDIRVERIIELGQATITVLDQNDQAVEGATVKFGGLSQATDSSGQTIFTSLEPGNYDYAVTEVPAAYALKEVSEEQRAEIAEAASFEATLVVDKKPEVGRIDLKVVNSQNQAIANATVRIGEKDVSSNADGVASFTDLAPGEYSFAVTKAPEGYLLETTDAQLTVIANQTVTQTVVLQTKPEGSSSESSAETSSESQESEVDESEAAEATQRYVDDATGVEVLVNPADAGKVVKLQVTKVTQPLDPQPAALVNMNADVYQVSLLDRDNQPVQLSRVAQVKLPTQPVTSQLRVVRISGANTSNLTFSLYNQKVNFSTQALGQFAIVYGAKAATSEESSSESTSESASTSVSVSKTTDVEQNLPNTGEIRSVWLIALAVLLALLGITLVVRKRTDK